MAGSSPAMTATYRPCHAFTESPPHPHQQREVDAEDHLRDEDGRGLQAASRPAAGRSGSSLRRTHGAMLRALAASVAGMPNAPPLLAGTGKDKVHLLSRSPPIAALPARSTPISAAPPAARPSPGSRRQNGQDPGRRPQRPRLPAPRTGQPHHGDISYRRQAPPRILRRRGRRHPHHHHAGRGRDRRLHPDLQPLPLGHLADRDRAAAHPRAAAA